jgi:hypothetical protein
MGLCSGANWAFHLAQRDPRVTAGILLNPRAFFWSRWAVRGHDARRARAVVAGSAWRRVLRGEIPLRRLLPALVSIARHLLRAPLRRLRPRTGAGDPLAGALATVERHDRRLLVVFTDREPLRASLEADGGMDKLAASPAVQLEIVATGAEMHTLPQLVLQRQVGELVDGALEAAVRASAGRRTPGRA